MHRACATAIGHPVDLGARLGRIEQRGQTQAARREVMGALRRVYAIQRLRCLQFNGDCVLDQHINGVLPDDDIVVADRYTVLLSRG